MKRCLVLKTNCAVCFQNGQKNLLLFLLGYNYVHNFGRTLTKLVTVGTKKDHLQLHHIMQSVFNNTKIKPEEVVRKVFFQKKQCKHQIPSLTDPGERLVLFCKINNKAIFVLQRSLTKQYVLLPYRSTGLYILLQRYKITVGNKLIFVEFDSTSFSLCDV